jgi:thioredoxin 1
MGKAQAVTSSSFQQEVLNSDVPVLVDFWATWCGPCLAIAPVIDALADEFKGKAKVVKLDVDENGDVAGEYGIRSIPTLMVFKNGKVVKKHVGGMSMAGFSQMIEEAIAAEA